MLKKKIIGKVPSTISGLQDTDIHDVTDGQVLKYNAAKEKWENGAGGSGGGAVNSVNGKTGAVELTASDVGAMPADAPIPQVGNGTITIKQGGVFKSSFTVNQNSDTIVELEAGGGGGAVNSVNGKTGDVTLTASDVGAQTSLTPQTAYRDKGSATKVPMINTNELGQVTSISEVSINVGQGSKADKVSRAVAGNLAGLDATGNLTDTGIAASIILSLQSQINDIYDQLVGVSATAVPRHGRVIVTDHAAPVIDISISSTDSMDAAAVYRVLNPGTESETSTSIYTSSTTDTSWSCTDGGTQEHAFTTPTTAGPTLAYDIIVTKESPLAEKRVRVYLNVVEDAVNALSWDGLKSITPSTVEVGNYATIARGEITATYLSGDTEEVTNLAEFYSISGKGTVSGTTYTAVSEGADTVGCRYEGVSAAQTLSVTNTSSRLNVQFGVGTTYANAVWTTVGPLTNNLAVNGISNAQGDYLFIKYDKRDTVNNLWINSDIPSQIDLDAAITDDNYKYRRSEMRGASLAPINYIINKV